MAYIDNEKSTGLDVLTTLAAGDLHIVGDVSDSGRAKAIDQEDLETVIANSSHFVDELVGNSYFTTELAADSNFLTELTTNSTFQTAVNNFVTGGGGGAGGGGGTKLAVNTTPVTIASSAVEATILGGTIAIPANTLGTNNAIRFNVLVSNFQLDAGDVYIKLKYGATTIGQVAVLSDTLAATKGIISGYIVADGATNAQKGFLNVGITNQDVEASGAANVNISKLLGSITGTATEDSTTSLNLDVTVEFSSASATNTITTQAIVVEKISSITDGVSFIATANEDLTAGQTVGISNLGGGVAIALRPKTADTFPDTKAGYGKAISLGTNRFFYLYQVAPTTLKGVVATVDKTTNSVSFGTPVTYTTTFYDLATNPFGGANPGSISCCLLDTDKVAVMYSETGAPKDLKIHVSTIAGTVITANSAQSFATLTNNNLGLILIPIGTDKAALHTCEGTVLNPQVRTFDVSGTTLGTVGSAVTSILAFSGVKHDTDAFSLVGQPSGANDNYIQCFTISGTTTTAGSATLVSSPVSINGSVFSITSNATNNIIFTYADATSRLIRAASISGTTPTLGTAVSLTPSTSNVGVAWHPTNSEIYVGDGGTLKVYTISGTTISFKYTPLADSAYATLLENAGANSFINLDTYFVIVSISGTSCQSTIKGMSGASLPGIVVNTVSAGANATILTKGTDSNQSGLIPGQRYIPDGTGGLTASSTGDFTAITTSSVSL